MKLKNRKQPKPQMVVNDEFFADLLAANGFSVDLDEWVYVPEGLSEKAFDSLMVETFGQNFSMKNSRYIIIRQPGSNTTFGAVVARKRVAAAS